METKNTMNTSLINGNNDLIEKNNEYINQNKSDTNIEINQKNSGTNGNDYVTNMKIRSENFKNVLKSYSNSVGDGNISEDETQLTVKSLKEDRQNMLTGQSRLMSEMLHEKYRIKKSETQKALKASSEFVQKHEQSVKERTISLKINANLQTYADFEIFLKENKKFISSSLYSDVRSSLKELNLRHRCGQEVRVMLLAKVMHACMVYIQNRENDGYNKKSEMGAKRLYAIKELLKTAEAEYNEKSQEIVLKRQEFKEKYGYDGAKYGTLVVPDFDKVKLPDPQYSTIKKGELVMGYLEKTRMQITDRNKVGLTTVRLESDWDNFFSRNVKYKDVDENGVYYSPKGKYYERKKFEKGQKGYLYTEKPDETVYSDQYINLVGDLDHAVSEKYRNKPIFERTPSMDDVEQMFRAYNCYMLAPLASMVEKDPEYIRSLFHDHGDGTVTVKLAVNYKVTSKGGPTYKEAEPLYVRISKEPYYSSTGKRFAPGDNCYWGALLQKAVVYSGLSIKLKSEDRMMNHTLYSSMGWDDRKQIYEKLKQRREAMRNNRALIDEDYAFLNDQGTPSMDSITNVMTGEPGSCAVDLKYQHDVWGTLGETTLITDAKWKEIKNLIQEKDTFGIIRVGGLTAHHFISILDAYETDEDKDIEIDKDKETVVDKNKETVEDKNKETVVDKNKETVEVKKKETEEEKNRRIEEEIRQKKIEEEREKKADKNKKRFFVVRDQLHGDLKPHRISLYDLYNAKLSVVNLYRISESNGRLDN